MLIFCYSYESLLGVAAALGVAKGLRTVYWSLVIPDYVPIERLPAASGLQSVTNGLVFMALGPLMGECQSATTTQRNASSFSHRLASFHQNSGEVYRIEGLIIVVFQASSATSWATTTTSSWPVTS